MAFKPNYNQQRAERNRAKQAKKDEKQREREEEVARRKAGLPPLGDHPGDGGPSVAAEEDAELNEGGLDGTAKA
jgi:hypothetical protein